MRRMALTMLRGLHSQSCKVVEAVSCSGRPFPAVSGDVPRFYPRASCSRYAVPHFPRTSVVGVQLATSFPSCKGTPMAQRRMHVCAAAATETAEETFTYQAEVDRLMDMIVNSLYSNREVFIRELISNASDALDKKRFLSLTDSSAQSNAENLEIRIKADTDANTITIEDTGVGMTRQEMLDSLGTIARSGTAKFAEAMKEAKNDANLIGQFGVGFYSAFLVSDRVVVQTKSSSDPSQWRWESAAGSHKFKVAEDAEGDLTQGTRVTLHLKPDAAELASDRKLAQLIKQYSEFIQFPIHLWSSSVETEQVVDEEATAKAQTEADEKAKAEGKEAAEPVEPVKKTNSKTVWGWKVQNDNKPLWTRSPKEVGKEEYDAFYKSTFREFVEPLAHAHFNVEGTIEFSALLFVPGMAPFEQQDWMKKSRNIRLFVKRVFISDEFDEDLLPRYLGFMKGVVDSSDLPLNVSREILQESRVVRTIKRQLVKRSLELIKDIAERKPEGDARADYDTFWESFGKYLKLGAIEDSANKTALAGLLRFPTSKSGDDLASLADYVARMKEGQKAIYFISADSVASAASAPFVEQLIKKDLEVVYLVEPIDEPAINAISEFEGKNFVDVTREDLDLGDADEDKKKAEEAAAAFKPLTEFIKDALGERVERVVVSTRLADSPCALVTSKFGWSAYQERVMRTQTLADNRAAEYMRGRRIMELNPDHAIVQALRSKVDTDAAAAKDMAELMYETALLTSGFTLDSPKTFASRIYSMMGLAAGTSNGAATSADASKQEAPAAAAVDPEVLGADGDDPWRQ